ncbi:MAG: hypothetical protein HQK49_18405 [Oligoflexia bacterium]|nr:hypothetical protein [Oligoflexia bacterium]
MFSFIISFVLLIQMANVDVACSNDNVKDSVDEELFKIIYAFYENTYNVNDEYNINLVLLKNNLLDYIYEKSSFYDNQGEKTQKRSVVKTDTTNILTNLNYSKEKIILDKNEIYVPKYSYRLFSTLNGAVCVRYNNSLWERYVPLSNCKIKNEY